MTAHPSESIFYSTTSFGILIVYPSRKRLFVRTDNDEGREFVGMVESSDTRERAEMLAKFECLAR